MKIRNQTKNSFIAENVRIADTFWTRFVGLLNRNSISREEALIITQCKSIHMFFMRFSIDVVFVSKENVVVGLVKKIPPFGLSPLFFRSSYAVELAPGIIDEKNIAVGDRLEIVS